jgi:hypothetical protein
MVTYSETSCCYIFNRLQITLRYHLLTREFKAPWRNLQLCILGNCDFCLPSVHCESRVYQSYGHFKYYSLFKSVKFLGTEIYKSTNFILTSLYLPIEVGNTISLWPLQRTHALNVTRTLCRVTLDIISFSW